ILRDLAARVGCAAEFTGGRDETEWLPHLYTQWRAGARTNEAPLPEFGGFWKDGPLEIPSRQDEYVLFADFRTNPEGHKLGTPSGKIELYSDRIAGFAYADCPPHPAWIEPSEWLGAVAEY